MWNVNGSIIVGCVVLRYRATHDVGGVGAVANGMKENRAKTFSPIHLARKQTCEENIGMRVPSTYCCVRSRKLQRYQTPTNIRSHFKAYNVSVTKSTPKIIRAMAQQWDHHKFKMAFIRLGLHICMLTTCSGNDPPTHAWARFHLPLTIQTHSVSQFAVWSWMVSEGWKGGWILTRSLFAP